MVFDPAARLDRHFFGEKAKQEKGRTRHGVHSHADESEYVRVALQTFIFYDASLSRLAALKCIMENVSESYDPIEKDSDGAHPRRVFFRRNICRLATLYSL